MSSYDQSLLHDAPKATRAQLQEGYNVDLLAEQPVRRTPSLRSPPPPPQSPQPPPVTVPLIPEGGTGEKFVSPVYPPATATKPRTSFWRTRNGILTIAVIILVVVGAVVGGAVGGTIKKSNNKTTDITGTTNATSSITSHSTVSVTGTQGVAGQNGTARPTSTTPVLVPTQSGENTGKGGVGK